MAFKCEVCRYTEATYAIDGGAKCLSCGTVFGPDGVVDRATVPTSVTRHDGGSSEPAAVSAEALHRRAAGIVQHRGT